MKKCFFCSTVVPAETPNANFCVACGRPITQPCPYEAALGQAGAEILPLCDTNGRATSSCPKCNGLFKVCSVCRRLNELNRVTCHTGCGATLREPIAPYPSSAGGLDGARAARWSGTWNALAARSPKPLVVETLQALAFRYGLLLGATRRDLICWRWNDSRWEPLGIQSLINSGEMMLKSLCVEQGRAFALGADRALVYSLVGGLSRHREEIGAFTHQTVNARWWTRIGADGRLLMTDCETWQMHEKHLREEAGQVSAVAGADEQVYLATENGFLFQLSPEDGKITDLGRYNQRWVRLAVQGGRLLAMGYDTKSDTGSMNLLTQMLGGTPASCSLGTGVVPDFAWLGDSICVVREVSAGSYATQGKTLLSTYSARQLTAAPNSVTISGTAVTVPGMIALGGTRGDARLLLRQQTDRRQQWSAVEPQTGNQLTMELKSDRISADGDIDGWPNDAPLACMADTRLIIASQEEGKTALRTYLPQETA